VRACVRHAGVHSCVVALVWQPLTEEELAIASAFMTPQLPEQACLTAAELLVVQRGVVHLVTSLRGTDRGGCASCCGDCRAHS
jgi:hypothetical protein